MKHIYLDHLATTPLDPRVRDAMVPYLNDIFGNPSSRGHHHGLVALEAVRHSRRHLGAILDIDRDDIVFTSGATESNNLAIRGVVEAVYPAKKRIITSAVEHSSVLEPCRGLARFGVEVIELPVDHHGRIRLEDLEAALTHDTALVSIQHVGNELGCIQDIAPIASLSHRFGALFHSDMAQCIGKIPVKLRESGVDLASMSAHKLYGPKGSGALYIRDRGRGYGFVPQIIGGRQQSGLRAGTMNLPGIFGFAEALTIAEMSMAEEAGRLAGLRAILLGLVQQDITGLRVNSDLARGLPGVLHISIDGVDQGALLGALRGISVSSGAACQSESGKPSHVLRACGLLDSTIRASLRISLGRFTTEEEVREAARIIVEATRKIRNISPF